jgi:serine/threonine-protein kinase
MEKIGKIGKYRLLERLGRGGRGSVFRSHDPTLDRFVAIRVVPWELNVTDQRRARVYELARAWAGLGHPNLVTAYDVGKSIGTGTKCDGSTRSGFGRMLGPT